MNDQQMLQMIAGMALVTYLPRWVPMLLLSGKQLPIAVERWLSYVPAALLGALLCASLGARPGEASFFGFDLRYVLAALPTGYIAMRSHSILLTVVVGVAAAVGARIVLARLGF